MAKQNYNFKLPEGIEKDVFIKMLFDNINSETELDDLLAIYKNGSVSFNDMSPELTNILTKNQINLSYIVKLISSFIINLMKYYVL